METSNYIYKKKAMDTPELTRRDFLKGLLKSKSKIITGQCFFPDKCVDSKSMLTSPKRTACKECDLPIHDKCEIDNGLILAKTFYCCYDCMRDDEMISAAYTLKYATFHDDEEYVCYLSEHGKRQDAVSKFMVSIMGDKLEPSKDYGSIIIHKGSKLGTNDENFPIFQRRLLIMYYYITPNKMKRVINYY